MNSRKVIALCLVTNIAILAIVLGVFAWTQPAQAQGSPSAPNAPSQPMAGPYYASYSGADFRSFVDNFSVTRITDPNDSGIWSVVRQSSQGIAEAPVHLPDGALVTQIMNDSNSAHGQVDIRFFDCQIGQTGYSQCTAVALARQNSGGRGQAYQSLNTTINSLSHAYFLELFLDNNDSNFFYAQIQYTVPSSFLFMPAIQH